MSTRVKKKHPYYNFDKLYSFNGVYNFCVGARGLGKTYGAKKKFIAAAIKKGEQFIYLRRYKTELKAVRETIFADVKKEFPDWEFRINGMVFEMAPVSTQGEKKRTWTVIGYLIALSGGQMMKSVSFEAVTTIVFDEFILEDGTLHYLPDEATVFNNFYATVDRWQDKTKVFFLANSVSIMNPYFLEYEIRPDETGEWVRKHDGFIVAHFPDSEEFKKSVSATRFGKFISGSDYEKYAVGNEFDDNHDLLISIKDENYRHRFNLDTKFGEFSIWYSIKSNEYYAQRKLPKSSAFDFTLIPNRVDSKRPLLVYGDRPLELLRKAFRTGRMTFDTQSTRNAFAEIARR